MCPTEGALLEMWLPATQMREARENGMLYAIVRKASSLATFLGNPKAVA